MSLRSHVTAVSLLLFATNALGASACDPFDAPEPVGFTMHGSEGALADASTPGPTDVDMSAALAAVVGGAYRGAGFTHVTRTPYASTASPGSFVDEWVSTTASAEYAKVQPDGGDSGASLAPGAMIVRAVLDADAGVTKLTLMLKGPAGANTDLGDWLFAVTDPSGVPLADDAGVLAGRLTACYGCHVPRGGDDFLFGVPLDDRTATE